MQFQVRRGLFRCLMPSSKKVYEEISPQVSFQCAYISPESLQGYEAGARNVVSIICWVSGVVKKSLRRNS